jgi:hypothetical protein
VLTKTKFSDEFVLNGIHFYGCRKSLDTSITSGVIIVDALCSTETISQHLSISSLKDGGEIYKIYNDSVCSNFNLQRYPNNITIAELAIDYLNEKQFCETYINQQ